MNIEELYEDSQFNNLLVMMANEKRIVDFDDFRQDVFVEIIDSSASNMRQYKKAAWRVASRERYRTMLAGDTDIASLAYENENGELEADDEVMARLVHSGRGRYIS
jgi:hypothetical protein